MKSHKHTDTACFQKKKKGIIDYRKVQNHVANKKQNMKVITESKIW